MLSSNEVTGTVQYYVQRMQTRISFVTSCLKMKAVRFCLQEILCERSAIIVCLLLAGGCYQLTQSSHTIFATNFCLLLSSSFRCRINLYISSHYRSRRRYQWIRVQRLFYHRVQQRFCCVFTCVLCFCYQ